MDIKKRFGTDRKLEQDGVWVDIGDGGKVKVARIGNPKYNETFQTLVAPRREAARRGTLSNEEADEILLKTLATTVLLDWEGIKVDGKDLKTSTENAYMLLKQFPDFRALVQEIAGNIETFRVQSVEASAKNL